MLAIAWRWPRHAGWAIGIAAAAKLMMVLVVAWLIGRRDWRGVAMALAIPAVLTAAAMVLTSPSVVIDFVIVRLNQQPTPGVVRFGLSDLGVPEVITWLLTLAVAALAVWRASFNVSKEDGASRHVPGDQTGNRQWDCEDGDESPGPEREAHLLLLCHAVLRLIHHCRRMGVLLAADWLLLSSMTARSHVQ